MADPAGALPVDARRLDPQPDLWDAEARLDLLGIVLDVRDLAWLDGAFGPDPTTRRAALLDACAERGGLPTPLVHATLVGRVAAVGPAFRQPVDVGDTVVATGPARALPTWVSALAGWDGTTRVAPARGHVIVGSASPLVRVSPRQSAEVSAAVAAVADLPGLVGDLVHPGVRVAVVGGTTVAGALAAVVAVRRGAGVVAALVTSLQDARVVGALGGVSAVIGDVHVSGEAASDLARALGGPADVTVVAADEAEAVTAGVLVAGNGTVLLVDGAAHAPHAAAVAASIGTAPVIRVDRPGVTDAGVATTAVVGSSRTLAELVRWRAGVGPAPTATRPEDV